MRTQKRKTSRLKSFLFPSLIAAFIAFDLIFAAGCVKLMPGADPLIVRAEQTEQAAKASFDLVLSVDHLDRGFWRTNAPAFHSFCEWLRQPQPAMKTNLLPRGAAMIADLNDVKNTYRLAHSESNALITAIATLGAVNEKAAAWSAIVKPAK